jgi:hypothetical protein
LSVGDEGDLIPMKTLNPWECPERKILEINLTVFIPAWNPEKEG